jgi:hypothetical protein
MDSTNIELDNTQKSRDFLDIGLIPISELVSMASGDCHFSKDNTTSEYMKARLW